MKVKSTPQVRTDLFRRKLDRVLVTDFFGSVRNVELLEQTSEKPERRGGESVTTPTNSHSFPPGRYLTTQDLLVRGRMGLLGYYEGKKGCSCGWV